jgi:Taurine catabolism dioxygenase TauD, TfdA family
MDVFHGVDTPAIEQLNGIHTERSNAGNATKSINNAVLKEPLKLYGVLKGFKSIDVAPVIGTEFPDAKLTDWMKATNSDELLRDLAITSKPYDDSMLKRSPDNCLLGLVSQRGVVFFRRQTDFTDDLQKELAQRLGGLTGKPSSSSLHIHPLVNFNMDRDKNVNVITTDQAARPVEDLFMNQTERPLGARGGWHTDIGYEPCPADYTILKLVTLPKTGGGMDFKCLVIIYN